jgi:DeoR family fructose operon transcriptional repressor
MLDNEASVLVGDLSRLFQVSEVTIRKDLRELEESGMLKRMHGGAVNIATATFEPTMVEKEEEYRSEKTAIARAALELLGSDNAILLDAGTTTFQLACLLKTRKERLTVVTNAINIAAELAGVESVDLIITGGNLRQRTLSLVGPIAEKTLGGLSVDKAFISTNGLDLEHGLTTPNIYEAEIKRMMIKSARQVILMADHSKFGQVLLSSICSLAEIDCVITDAGTPEDYLAKLRDSGIEVIVANE